jgi:hypothetical protein
MRNHTLPPSGWNAFNLIAGVCSIAGFFIAMPATDPTRSHATVLGLLSCGLLAALLHGAAWSTAEKIFQWEFGGGDGVRMPTGWEAIVLSLSMTLPLMVAPIAGQLLFPFFFDSQLVHVTVPRNHFIGSLAIIVLAAAGHVLLYGTPTLRFVGLKNLIFPIGASPNIPVAITMELIYGVIHFSTIAVSYRYIAFSAPIWDATKVSLPFALVWFFFLVGYILLLFPRSLAHPRWMGYRGVLSAFMLMVCLMFAMLV